MTPVHRSPDASPAVTSRRSSARFLSLDLVNTRFDLSHGAVDRSHGARR
ncbi:hypothetical protein [Streptomyces sp. BH104]